MNNKALIKKDVIGLVMSEIDKTELKKLDLTKFFAVRVGNVLVQKPLNAKPFISIPEGLNKDYMSLWNNDVGKVLLNELKKDAPELYELRAVNFTTLMKKVAHEEEESFMDKGLLHIKIGDFYFTIIKVISANSHYHQKTSDFDPDVYKAETEDESRIIIIDDPEEKKDEEEIVDNTFRLF
jgi:hypothetical protein